MCFVPIVSENIRVERGASTRAPIGLYDVERTLVVPFSCVRIMTTGKMRNYISYATNLLEEKGSQQVILKAMGRAINKTVAIEGASISVQTVKASPPRSYRPGVLLKSPPVNRVLISHPNKSPSPFCSQTPVRIDWLASTGLYVPPSAPTRLDQKGGLSNESGGEQHHNIPIPPTPSRPPLDPL
eukprot:1187691-Prorocentrum_minimum.AAC.1